MIQLTIDGQIIQVEEGSTVLQAARAANIHIPTLCDHPELTPYGGCRLCLVEVDGFRTPQASCTLPASSNMVVHTNTTKLQEARKFILTLIFSERNHFCPFCQVSGGDCELQNAAYDEGMANWPISPTYNPYPVDASHPYFILDNNRCILCRRCVRACSDLVGNHTLGMEERGARTMVIADFGLPLGSSTCISCGACVQVCPTGALIDRWSAYRGHVHESDVTETICIGCSMGCGIHVRTRDNQLLRIDGNWQTETNEGLLCETGRFQPMVENRQRITTPMIRKHDQLTPVTWEEALQEIARLFNAAPGGIAALASTRLPAEALYAFQQIFSEKLHSELVTSTEEGKTTAHAAALARQTATPFEARLDALKQADCVLLIGTDLRASHEVASFFFKRMLLLGTRLIVIDPTPNPLNEFAHVVIKATANSDLFQTLQTNPTGDLATAAQILAQASHPVIIYGEGITAQSSANALQALVQYAHHIKASLVNLKGQANSLAASQYGLEKPFVLKGQSITYLALGDEQPTQHLIQQLEAVPTLIIQASHASALTARAQVVLPVTSWLEQEGAYVSFDGRVQQAKAALPAPTNVRTNLAVLQALANCLNLTIENTWKEKLNQSTPAVQIA